MSKLDSLSNKQIFFYILTFVLPISLFIVLICIGFVGEGSQQFSDLANAFVHGQTNFLHPIGGLGQDPVYYNGKIYWDEGPFPAVILMPFVALFNIWHIFFYQGYIKWAFLLGIAYFIYKLARHFKYSKEDSYMFILAFSLASVFVGVGGVSSGWLYAQVVGAFLCFWSLYEYYFKRRWWLIGTICSFIFLTRVSAAPIALFFLLAIWLEKGVRKQKLINSTKLLGLMFLAIVIASLYNYQRFGNPLDNGNQYQLLSSSSAEARSMGLFSLDHIPTNLYTMVLRGPDTVARDDTSWSLKFPYITNNSLGMSIFLTSPYLLYFFIVSWKKYPKDVKLLLAATAVSALLVLSYFGDGADQFGYRYSLDFMPELFLALMILYRHNNKALSTGMKSLIILTSVFDFYVMCSFVK